LYKKDKNRHKEENIISFGSRIVTVMGEYTVKCVMDGSAQPPYALSCPNDNSLLRTEYATIRLDLKDLPGIWRFYNWLPVKGIIPKASAGSVTYRSVDLAQELGLKNLYISFSGYWPERGAAMPTGSFKDLEAPPTMQRQKERGDNSTLVVASAGNTARAFAQVASLTGQRLALFVPEKALHRMWITADKDGSDCGNSDQSSIMLICVKGDYTDSILMAEEVQSLPGFMAEGGARNIARRDGMGTVMLEAAIAIGRIPDHYFQAVGSGTGGISAWEASLRLIGDDRFGSKVPRLHLAQNLPNAPIYYAWMGKEPSPVKPEMFDDVLFNRRPPYSIPGGVKDALEAANGLVYGITDVEAADAKRLFEESEVIDILNAPGVAIAALVKAVQSATINREDIVLLNITGGGVSRLKEDFSLSAIKCDASVSSSEEAVEFLEDR
jgi:cysteate synthase